MKPHVLLILCSPLLACDGQSSSDPAHETDPIAWVKALEAELSPVCGEFWLAWNGAEDAAPASASRFPKDPDLDHPGFVQMMNRCGQLLTPHLADDLPEMDAKSIRALFQHDARAVWTDYPQGELLARWHRILERSELHGDEIVQIRCGNKMPGGGEAWSPHSLHLRRIQGAWKICAWPRDDSDQSLPSGTHATPYIPDPNALKVSLAAGEQGLSMKIGYGREILAPDVSALQQEATLLSRGYLGAEDHFLDNDPRHPELPRSRTITLWSDAHAPQGALTPILQSMVSDACPTSKVRLQAVLGATTLPVEYVFDQSLTRPGADASGSVGVPLGAGQTIQQLCDRVDRLIEGGAKRFHLLPPE